MPADNAMRLINEMYRLLSPGGLMNGFEVPFEEDIAMRWTAVLFNTWGHNWQDDGPQGPEPYMEEYEFGTMLTESLSNVGFKNVRFTDYSYFEGIFQAEK